MHIWYGNSYFDEDGCVINNDVPSQNLSYVYNSNENIKFSNSKSFSFEMIFKKNTNIDTIIFGDYSSGQTTNESWSSGGNMNAINIRFLGCRFPDSGSYKVDVSKPTSISCTYDSENTKLKYYINNILVQEFDSVGNSNEYGFTLGMRKGASSANNIKIYAVRYYDRNLNENEISYNYQIDKQKYGV